MIYAVCILLQISLVGQASYDSSKIKPLYPHYPVNIVVLYCIFWCGII
jgi:hypothetical protein